MRTIREFLDNKYAKREMGEEKFDASVSELSQHIITKHTAKDGLDKSFVEAVSPVVYDGNALIIEGAMGVTSMGAAVLGGGAVALGSDDSVLQSLGIAGATCAGVVLLGYIRDKINYTNSKAKLKNWIEDEIHEDKFETTKMSKRSRSACLDEVCESLGDEMVMEMK